MVLLVCCQERERLAKEEKERNEAVLMGNPLLGKGDSDCSHMLVCA